MKFDQEFQNKQKKITMFQIFVPVLNLTISYPNCDALAPVLKVLVKYKDRPKIRTFCVLFHCDGAVHKNFGLNYWIKCEIVLNNLT